MSSSVDGNQIFQPLECPNDCVFRSVLSNQRCFLRVHQFGLESKGYRRFVDFIQRFEQVFRVARELYPIQLRERLGLRYLDRICVEKQPFLPQDWQTRIRPEILPLRSLVGVGEPQLNESHARFAFADHFLAFRSTFVDKGFANAPQTELNLDFDCYSEKRAELDGLDALLQEFRSLAYNAFRWAMGDLISFFEPAESGGNP